MDKKSFRAQIEAKLETAFAEFSKDTTDKKFKKHIRKAGKILIEGLDLPIEKPNGKVVEKEEARPITKINGKKAVETKGVKVVKKAAVKKAMAKKAKASAKTSKPAETTGK